ncbi:MAG: hypothetical protein ACREB2_09640 [Pseudolabrys sp.]
MPDAPKLDAMSESTRPRRIVALAAAYVVALQALLLPLSIAAGGPFGASLCAATISVAGAPSPASRDSGCPCAAGCGTQCCVQTLADPPQVTFLPGLRRAISISPAQKMASVIRLADRSPQVPRAPPAA